MTSINYKAEMLRILAVTFLLAVEIFYELPTSDETRNRVACDDKGALKKFKRISTRSIYTDICGAPMKITYVTD